MTKPKFKPGRAVSDTGEAIRLMGQGRWFYLEHGIPGASGRPKHPGFLLSMTCRTLDMFCRRGSLILAEPRGDGK